MREIDEHFMRVALELARRGRGRVEPNPMVGAVIVRDSKVLGEGWHEKFGAPHAEVNALAAAQKNNHDVRGATMYVTLEPCSHHGKTPPCTDAIIKSGITRVAVGMQDPDNNVSGRGFEKLRESGIEVTTDICNDDARELLGAYIKLRTKARSWVICKWAQTADGYLALPPGVFGKNRWISSPQSRQRVHELRTLCDGVLVGVGTVLSDDPLLTVRDVDVNIIKRHPTRVVLDSSLKTPVKSKLIGSVKQAPIIVATTQQGLDENPKQAKKLRDAGAEILALSTTTAGIDLVALLDELGRRQWTYLLVEAGPGVLGSFIHNGLADELQVYVSPLQLNPQIDLPRFNISDVLQAGKYVQTAQEKVGADTLHIIRAKHP